MRVRAIACCAWPWLLVAQACVRGIDPTPVAQPGRLSIGATPLPCDVQNVLAVSCQGCHARDPGFSAPMALVTHEDLIAPAVSDPSVRVVDMLIRRIHEPDRARAMPPPSGRSLTADELAVLDAFANAGAPAGTEVCGSIAARNDPGASTTPDELGACYSLPVHNLALTRDTTPYLAPNGDYESCFYMDAPWPDGTQALEIRSHESALVHHWELFHTTEGRGDGEITREVSACDPALREIIAIFARGQQSVQTMPDGVGLVLPPPGPGLLLDVHYVNPGVAQADSTSVEICSARVPRVNAATVSALMSETFMLAPGQASMVYGHCTPPGNTDIHVFRTFPHMHARGVRMQLAVERASGASEGLLDVGFDFDHQVTYETPAIVHPGDQLLTTCYFINDTTRVIYNGPRASDEMCINFVYAWPAGALSNGFVAGLYTPCIL